MQGMEKSEIFGRFRTHYICDICQPHRCAKLCRPLVKKHRSMLTPLYPMLVVLMGLDNQVIQCPAYFILNQSGDSENMNRTPYFYTSKAARDYAVDKLSSLIHTHQRDTGG